MSNNSDSSEFKLWCITSVLSSVFCYMGLRYIQAWKNDSNNIEVDYVVSEMIYSVIFGLFTNTLGMVCNKDYPPVNQHRFAKEKTNSQMVIRSTTMRAPATPSPTPSPRKTNPSSFALAWSRF